MKVGDRESILKRIEELKISQQKCTSDFFYWGYVREIEDLEKQLKELPNAPITPKPFTKDDLRDGMICTLRNGERLIKFDDILVMAITNYFLNKYDNDLTYPTYNSLDIMQVTYNNEIVFKRNETKEIEIILNNCDTYQLKEKIDEAFNYSEKVYDYIKIKIEVK